MHRIVFIVVIYLLLPSRIFSQVMINEFSASNLSGITDEDGQVADWIELTNSSSTEINLNGYHLSDDKNFLSKWTLPDISIQPSTYLLVFASGKNRTDVTLSYETVIPKGSQWKYRIPASDIGNSWKDIGFNTSNWTSGNSGLGYGDNDDATVLPNGTICVYARKEFTITELDDVAELIFSIDYDDGFVAYINGHEIARNNLGPEGSVVLFDQATGSFLREATMYQAGGVPESFSILDFADFLIEGVNVLAVEGHNSDRGSSDLSLIPMLTLGLRGPGYTDNHPDYIVVQSRQLHTNFKISAEGETLFLSNPDTTQIDSVSAIPLSADISYGRKPDGGNIWYYFNQPTPGEANTSQGFGTISGDTVKFTFPGGYYPAGSIEVRLSTTDPQDTIVYTLDGSDPAINDLRYVNPIRITKNTIIRARAFNSQKLPGIISTNTYITKKHTLPVVCLSTEPANLFDYNTGIYVMGPNASTESPFFGANFWQDWERRAHMELYDEAGTKQIGQDVGIKIFGAYSRANPQRSLALFARREYGKGSFEYQFFKEKTIEKFESVVLRNAGNDWAQAFMRDGLTSILARGMDVDRQEFQPSIVYINGEYWGIMNIREKINANFLAENHFVNPDNVNILEGSGTVVEGSNVNYTPIVAYLNANTLETETKYLKIKDKIELNNYIQYQLTQIYVNNKDWPGNNVKFWQTKDPVGLWRWILFDTDFGWSIWEGGAYTFNTLTFALEPNLTEWPNPSWSTLFFRRMVTNKDFRFEFANQFADRINTNFSTVNAHKAIDSLKVMYLPEIQDHMARWGQSYDNWINNYTIIKNYATNRPAYMFNFLEQGLGLAGKLSVRIETGSAGSGSVLLNTIIPQKYPFTGTYFKDVPIKLSAIPAPGYKFVKWEGTVPSVNPTIEYNMEASPVFRAIFEPASAADFKIVINEINYNSSPEKDAKDWIELYNAGNTSVSLKDWVISDAGFDTGYKITSELILTPGMYLVVCREIEAFRLIYPEVSNSTGNLSFGLSSTGDDINLFDPEGVLIDYVNYTPNLPWPTDANGTGSSVELVDPLSDNNMGSNWKSSPNGGTPGEFNLLTLKAGQPDISANGTLRIDCFPNPFKDYTTFRIEVPASGKYKLEVFDLQGRLVSILAGQEINSGAYYIDWDGRDSNNEMLPQGVYIVRLSGESKELHLKLVKME